MQDEMKFEILPRDTCYFLSGMNAVIFDLETLLRFVFNSNLEVFSLISSPDSIATAARAEPSAVQILQLSCGLVCSFLPLLGC